jgi:hypothetical protein
MIPAAVVFLYLGVVLAIGLPSVFLGVIANRAVEVPGIAAKLEARATLAAEGPTLPSVRRDELQARSAGDGVIISSSRDMLRCG